MTTSRACIPKRLDEQRENSPAMGTIPHDAPPYRIGIDIGICINSQPVILQKERRLALRCRY